MNLEFTFSKRWDLNQTGAEPLAEKSLIVNRDRGSVSVEKPLGSSFIGN